MSAIVGVSCWVEVGGRRCYRWWSRGQLHFALKHIGDMYLESETHVQKNFWKKISTTVKNGIGNAYSKAVEFSEN